MQNLHKKLKILPGYPKYKEHEKKDFILGRTHINHANNSFIYSFYKLNMQISSIIFLTG